MMGCGLIIFGYEKIVIIKLSGVGTIERLSNNLMCISKIYNHFILYKRKNMA